MMRRTMCFLAMPMSAVANGLDGDGFGRSKAKKEGSFAKLWWKPETKDERVKEYVPEVLEESLREQQALLDQSTLRDQLVEEGHKAMRALENKAPTPSIAPSLTKMLEIYGSKGIINQRTLSYLLYPSSSSQGRAGAALSTRRTGAPEAVHELITSFGDNLTSLVEAIEQDGAYVDQCLGGKAKVDGDEVAPRLEAGEEKKSDEGESEEGIKTAPPSPRDKFTTEPREVTYFVKCVSGMGLANLHCSELRSAVKCCDAALDHVIDSNRKGGVLGLKAGILLKDKQFELAAATALQAIEASNSVQGYLHGVTALRSLKRNVDAIELLEAGVEAFPHNHQMASLLETMKEDTKLAIESGDSSKTEAIEGKSAPDQIEK